MSISGQLIVNRFLNTNKFTELTRLLCGAAERLGVFLEVRMNDEYFPAMGAGRDIMPGEKPDFVLFYDKDIRLASALEKRGFRLFNSSRAIELCDDKSLMHAALDGAIPMPATYCAPFTYENIGYNSTEFVEKMFDLLGAPLVIKEAFGSFGQQVYLAESPEAAREILAAVGGKRLIFQKFVSECAGRDIRINVVGGRVIAAMERWSESGDFRANITIGGSMREYRPTAEEERTALLAAERLGLDFCGVDILRSDDGPLLCEVNSNAHFKSIMQCTGVNAADEIMAHIARTVESL